MATVLAGCAGSPGSGAGSPTASPSASPRPPSIRFTPVDDAQDVPPKGTIKAVASHATITEAVMTNASGEKVDGSLAPDRTSWSAGEPLGYGKTYTLAVTARAANGRTITERSEFSTLTPEHTTYVSMNPLDGQTVGVGQPLAFYFSDDAPPPDKKRAEQAITVRTDPHVEGAFYWFDDREVHWRPREYWEPGTTVHVDIDVYGRNLGNGVYGKSDRTATITIGDSVILRADGASHRMSVEVDGEVVRTIPISMGRPSFPSHNGVHVVMRKSPTYLMDSTTYGLSLDEGGYKTEVKWAVRISNGGEFLHAAPWSVADQGKRNVSHGCINMSTSDAEWVYDLLDKGDVVKITNSGGEQLPPWDGFGDWQIPWSEWVQGNH
ncbi:L,D-transpeptidase [Halopolyspora algeriensis]|nr:Ig-like domain-containing protein [Halopolyspora algeriensis]